MRHMCKYDYSNVVYRGAENKVEIICPIHGSFMMSPHSHLKGYGCPFCSGKRVHERDFIERAKSVHNNKYDYSKCVYVDTLTPICIICPIHGEFWQTPSGHLSGRGCSKCAHIESRGLVHGVGFNSSIECEPTHSLPYNRWTHILQRCYGDKRKRKSYDGCIICNEWHDYSKFKEWFLANHVDGWQIDKDILVKGNKVYSPETCCFVPQEINTLFTSCRVKRGKYPLGVSFIKSKNRYMATVSIDNKNKTLGYFDNPIEAFECYKLAKESQIKAIANKWRDKLPKSTYDALIRYKIDIND